MRYLLTGITGFVGPHLANLLSREGHEVIGLVRSSNGREEEIRETIADNDLRTVRFVYGDVLDHERMSDVIGEAEPDGVFHLAAQSHPPTSFLNPRGTFQVNAVGTVNILEAIRRNRPSCRLLFCSTAEVYGAPAEGLGPINEDFPLRPINPYGVSKAAADLYVRERAASLQLPLFVTRAFSHTGPRRGRPFSIASDAYQITRIRRGLQQPIVRVGTLSSKRAVIDVRDCCRAYYLLMQSFTPGEAYNIGGDQLFTMGDLLEQMLQMSGLSGNVHLEVDPKLVRPIDIPTQVCDSSKCRQLTGWKPLIPIEQTLRDLLDYYWRMISRWSVAHEQEPTSVSATPSAG